jgi:hypothetical protein
MNGREQFELMMAWLAEQPNKHAQHARGQLTLLAMVREALEESRAECDALRERVRVADEMALQVGAVLACAGRALRREVESAQVIVAGFDKAPMRNLMATMYGLSPLGEPLPPKRTRKAKAVA